MSGRKLNRRQTWRAEKIQQERSNRANRKQRDLATQVQSGELSSEQQGLVISRYSKHFEVEALEGEDQGKIHDCVTRSNIGSIVAGDTIVWRSGAAQTGVIESRHKRKSILERPDNFGRLKPVAANIDQMLIVIACEPSPQPNLVDRYLVAAELMKVKPIIVVNKADLLTDQHQQIESLIAQFRSLGYEVVKIISSRHQAPDLAELPGLINGRTSIVVGQSGVGKSSLINTLLPQANLEIGALSEQTREGTHTTTQAKLFHLPQGGLLQGGQLIDSPGIRDFSLWHITVEQLEIGFVEIAKQLGHCRFRDCRHENEPACAVLKAVQSGIIGERRFSSFLRIKSAILEQQARGLSLS